jgi:hypothetical protein
MECPIRLLIQDTGWEAHGVSLCCRFSFLHVIPPNQGPYEHFRVLPPGSQRRPAAEA